VNQVGLVSGIAVGTATISATLDGIVGTSVVTVNPFLTIASDAFARGDSASSMGTADVGGPWTALRGVWGLNGGQAYNPTDDNFGNIAYLTTANSDVSVSTTFIQAPASIAMWLPFRIVDANNFLLLTAQTPTTVQVFRCVAGSFTQIFTTPYNWSNGDIPKVVTLGTTITVFVNGVQRGAPFTEANFSTAVKHGIGNSGGGGPTNRWGAFLITVP
jgi:hypothetical protein